MAALSTVIMISAYFPYLTYAIPAIASLPIMVVLVEINKKYSVFTFLASALPVFLFCEPEAKVLYLCFLGYYPILKALLEGLKSRVLEYILKFIFFNLAIYLVYLVSSFIIGISYSDLGDIGKYGVVIFILLDNIAFVAVDICITKLADFYILRLSKMIKKFLR